jgi:RNA polymerase sigma-70 factor (ECF subfamily)
MADYSGSKTEHLVKLAKQGDSCAQGQLYSIYIERVRTLVHFRLDRDVRCRIESMDIVQDAFISALQSLQDFKYQDEGDFLRWISTIALNRLRDNVDKLHADKRDIQKEVRFGNSLGSSDSSFAAGLMPADVATPSIIVSKREERDRLVNAMDKLKPEYKEVIVLIQIWGLSYDQAGKELNKNSEAVRKLFARAKVALAAVLEDTHV